MLDQNEKPQTRKIVMMVCANPACKKEFELDRQRRSLFQQGKQTVFFCSRSCLAQPKPKTSPSSDALRQPDKPIGRPRKLINVIVVKCANPACGKEIELDYYRSFRYRKGQSRFWCCKECKNHEKISQQHQKKGKRTKGATEPLITSAFITITTNNPVPNELSQPETEAPANVDVLVEIPAQPVTAILETTSNQVPNELIQPETETPVNVDVLIEIPAQPATAILTLDQNEKPQTRKIVMMVCANPACKKEFELDRQRRSLLQQGKQTVFFCSRSCLAQSKPKTSPSSDALRQPAKPIGRPRKLINVIVVKCANPACGKEIELDYYRSFRYRKGQSRFWCCKECKNHEKISQQHQKKGKRTKGATEPLITSAFITITTNNPVPNELSQPETEAPVNVDVLVEIPAQPVTTILETSKERQRRRKGQGKVKERVTVNCANPKCGKEFELNAQKRWAYRNGKTQFLCSKKCYTDYQTNRQPVTVSCTGCGIDFELDKDQYQHLVKGNQKIFYHDKECYLNREVSPPRTPLLSRPVVSCVGCGIEFELNVYQASCYRKGIQVKFYHSKQCMFDNRVLGSMAELRINSPYSKQKIPSATCARCGKKFEPVYTQRKRVSVGIPVYCCVSHSQGRG